MTKLMHKYIRDMKARSGYVFRSYLAILFFVIFYILSVVFILLPLSIYISLEKAFQAFFRAFKHELAGLFLTFKEIIWGVLIKGDFRIERYKKDD